MSKTFFLSGIPGVGKSTLLAELKKNLGDKFLILPEFLEPFPRFVNDAGTLDKESQIKAQEWVIRQHARKAEMAQKYKKPVIMERGIMDALAYSWALGKDVYEHSLNFASQYKWPDGNVFLLNAPEEIIKDRFTKRDHIPEKEWQDYWQPFMQRIRDGYRQNHIVGGKHKYREISTTGDIPSIVKILQQEIRRETTLNDLNREGNREQSFLNLNYRR